MTSDAGASVADGAGAGAVVRDPEGATVGLLLAEDANRSLLAGWLDDHHDVVPLDPADAQPLPPSVDCWLVDAGAAPAARAALADAKVDASPAFLPVIYLTRREVDLADERVWRAFDDVVVLPTARSALRGRLESLLRARRLSLALLEERERLDSFAGYLAHDLRNPLNVAEGYLALARDGDEGAFDVAAAALRRMQGRIQDALLLAREGETALAPVPCDLPAVAERAWATVRSADVGLETAPATVVADPEALERLLENLFRNVAEHATPTGDAAPDGAPVSSVTVRVGPLDDGFYVEDDGRGVSPGQRERIFEDRTTTMGGATGLGLAIVRRLAEVHGWTAACVESESGGARFAFRGVRLADG